MNFRFAYPWFAVLLLFWLTAIFRYWRHKTNNYTLRVGSLNPIRSLNHRSFYKKWIPDIFRYLALVLMIAALMRPQLGNVTRELTQKGIDIMLTLDISGSMRALDFEPNRLEASKKVALEFVDGRKTDRIGLVVFGGESFLQCPLTIDYDVLKNIIGQMEIIPEEYDGTAIGLAISNAINRLRDSDGKSKIIILLSDGANNSGEIDPLTAAQFAKEFNIKIYTIAMGRNGRVMMPISNGVFGAAAMPVDMKVDDKLLQSIAEATGGKFFKADTEEKLKAIWEEISNMETTEIKMAEYLDWDEKFLWFLMPAFMLLALEMLLRRTVWRMRP